MDFPAFILSLLSGDWLFFLDNEIAWDGRHHTITGIQVNGAQLADLMGYVSTFADDFEGPEEVARYLIGFLNEVENDGGLRVPRSSIAPGVRQAIRDGDLTGITLANLAACGSAFSVRMVGDNQYALIYDARLARGIPHFFDLTARLLWDLRQCTRSEKGAPFVVAFAAARNLDADQYLGDVRSPVADAQDDPGAMLVTSQPKVGAVGEDPAPSAGVPATRTPSAHTTCGTVGTSAEAGGPAAAVRFWSGLDHPTPTQADESLFEGQLMGLIRGLPSSVPIEGTHHRGRAARIEHVQVGDPLVLVADWENRWFDPVAIEVFDARGGTLGYLARDSTLMDFATQTGYRGLACLLPHLSASVASVTPLSKRRKNAKYALLDVRIELEPGLYDEDAGSFDRRLFDEAKEILRRPRPKRTVASLAPAGGVAHPVLSTALERAERTAKPSGDGPTPLQVPQVRVEGTTCATEAAAPGTTEPSASVAAALAEPFAVEAATHSESVALPEDVELDASTRALVQKLAWTIAAPQHLVDVLAGGTAVPQRLVDVLAQVATRRRHEELKAALPENWTFTEGRRVSMPEFSLAVPDGWKASEEQEHGDGTLWLHPANTGWDEADDLGGRDPVGIFYCPMEAPSDKDPGEEPSKLAIPETARVRAMDFWTTDQDSPAGLFAADARVVRGINCDVLVLRNTSAESLMHRGLEYEIVPCMGGSFSYLRLWFPGLQAEHSTATLDKVCELARTVELTKPFEFDLVTNVEMCQGMEVDADFFADTCEELRWQLKCYEMDEIDIRGKHAWQKDAATEGECRLIFRAGAFHYATELYDAYEAQEGYGVDAEGLKKMLASVGEFLQFYWFAGDGVNVDSFDGMYRLRYLTADDAEELHEPDGLEDLFDRIERDHPGFGATFRPQTVVAAREADCRASEQAYEKAQELGRRIDSMGLSIEGAEQRVRILRDSEPSVPEEVTDPIYAELTRLMKEREELGVFARKRKKELTAQISAKWDELNCVEKRELQASWGRLEADRARAQEELDHLTGKREGLLTEQGAVFQPLFSGKAVSDTVFFGRYPQDKEGKVESPVEWTVLEVKDDELLLISTYVLDWRKLTDKGGSIGSFKECDLATWLRDNFASATFSHFERPLVVGVPTLLPATELERYLPTEENRMSKATAYAVSHGADIHEDYYWAGCTSYWTGDESVYGSYWGAIDGGYYSGCKTYAACGVRPAIRVRTQS